MMRLLKQLLKDQRGAGTLPMALIGMILSTLLRAARVRVGAQRLLRNQRGGLLVETVLVLAVIGVLGTTVLGAVQTSYIGKRQFDAQSTAENLIRNQMESVFAQTYKAPDDPDPTYLAISSPAGYSVTAEALTYDVTSTDVATVRITVFKDGQQVKVLETLRAKR